MTSTLDRFVRRRARYLCEYCQFPSQLHPAPFQIDHIIAKQHGGQTVPENLALACLHCNRYKGPNIAGVDPSTGEITPLFHPRTDLWTAHFRWQGAYLIGLTPRGRATVQTLNLNLPSVVALRAAIREEGTPSEANTPQPDEPQT